jgi:hypothetical protein
MPRLPVHAPRSGIASMSPVGVTRLRAGVTLSPSHLAIAKARLTRPERPTAIKHVAFPPKRDSSPLRLRSEGNDGVSPRRGLTDAQAFRVGLRLEKWEPGAWGLRLTQPNARGEVGRWAVVLAPGCTVSPRDRPARGQLRVKGSTPVPRRRELRARRAPYLVGSGARIVAGSGARPVPQSGGRGLSPSLINPSISAQALAERLVRRNRAD